jgi:hypothetical protein
MTNVNLKQCSVSFIFNERFDLSLFFCLDAFKYDEQYEENERKYKKIHKIILDENSNDEYKSSENCSSSDDEDDQKKNDVNEESK